MQTAWMNVYTKCSVLCNVLMGFNAITSRIQTSSSNLLLCLQHLSLTTLEHVQCRNIPTRHAFDISAMISTTIFGFPTWKYHLLYDRLSPTSIHLRSTMAKMCLVTLGSWISWELQTGSFLVDCSAVIYIINSAKFCPKANGVEILLACIFPFVLCMMIVTYCSRACVQAMKEATIANVY